MNRVLGITERVHDARRALESHADRLLSSLPESDQANVAEDPPRGNVPMLHAQLGWLEHNLSELESQVRRLEML